MNLDTFRHEFKQRGSAFLTDSIILFRKPLELYNLRTGETIAVFKGRSVDPVLDYELDGVPIIKIIEKMNSIPIIPLNGGRGGSSGLDSWSGKFGHAPRGGGGDDRFDFPARLNVRMGAARTPEEALKVFREAHVKDGYESGVAVDEHGFVTRYVHGGYTSVGIWGTKGEMVYHNHPGEFGGNFSDSDLISVSSTGAKGIVASAREGDYIFVKTHHFNPSGFVKAMKNATLRGKDYTDAADKWLKANQSKYGYTYRFEKAK